MNRRRTAGELTSANTICAVLLLLLYIAGSVEIDALHNVVHSHDPFLHSIENENDPCHRARYHNIGGLSCGHTAHFDAKTECNLCGLAFHADQQITIAKVINTPSLFTRYDAIALRTRCENKALDLPTRAPPVTALS